MGLCQALDRLEISRPVISSNMQAPLVQLELLSDFNFCRSSQQLHNSGVSDQHLVKIH